MQLNSLQKTWALLVTGGSVFVPGGQSLSLVVVGRSLSQVVVGQSLSLVVSPVMLFLRRLL